MTLLDDMWRLWKSYVDYYVVGNPELKQMFFWVFLSIVLTAKKCGYIESSDKKSLRLHIFILQDSGTGKSQIMKALHNLLLYCGVRSRWTIKDNEACLTGTVYLSNPKYNIKGEGKQTTQMSREIKVKHGLLKELQAICWDEGSVLLKQSAYMDILTDIFQGVMDEPGRVSKGMRLGLVEYPTDVTVVAGSYMFPEFKDTLVSKGFLQRMYLSFKEFTEKEKRDIRIGIGMLKLRRDKKRARMLKEAIRIVLDRLPCDEILEFNPDAVRKFNADLEETYKHYIEHQFAYEKQRVLETFFNRLHVMIDKIATIKAIMDERTIVEYEDLQYALSKCKWHIESLQKIFDYLDQGKTSSVQDKREREIIMLLKRLGGEASQAEILEKLKDEKILDKWDLGFNRSIDLLNKMIDKRVLHSHRGKKGAKILLLK